MTSKDLGERRRTSLGQQLPEPGPLSSVADQVPPDTDHVASRADGAASFVDQQQADLEQRAADHDQAAADLEAGASIATPLARAAHRRARDMREQTARVRAATTAWRRETDTWRMDHDAGRQRIARQRAATPLDRDGRTHFIRQLLPGALARDEFGLAFQPLCDLETAAVVGVEALVRWNTEPLGNVRPDEFIPEAERTGLVIELGEWVLQTAIAATARWRIVMPTFTIAVNVAPEQLTAHFVTAATNHLAHTGLPASALTLEVTERTLMADPASTLAASEALRAQGVKLSADDFGTGFSSLGRLAQLGLDELKIDRIFTAGIAADLRQRALVAGIIAMSGSLGFNVIAEGIETDLQRTILLDLGCQRGQGYFLAKPMDAAGIDRLLQSPSALLR